MSYLLIIGAKSDIAKEVARKYSRNGFDLYLAARKAHELKEFSNVIKVESNTNVELVEADILDYKSHQDLYNSLKEKPLGVISTVGYLGSQINSETSFSETQLIIDTNYTGLVSFFNIIADDFEERKYGFIIGVSSVGGDRGRKSNYLYGSSKAGFSTYLSGLRNRLYSSGVHVMTVKPGYVYTKMTKNMDLPPALSIKPDRVAKDIFDAQQKGKDVLYTKSIWRWIMLFIKIIPEYFFKKTNL
jgi:decaprenylphospho-beta-D-erythro-pentofuranosid-2-ulose 2-reductase